MRKNILVPLAILLFAAPAFATTMFQPGTTYQTTALTGFTTSGDQMAGMTVTVTDSAGDTFSALWEITGAGAGAATGTGWSLVESGDTWNSTWYFNSNFNITKLFIDAGTGNTVFDVEHDPYPGTEGSANGKSISDNNNVIYRDYVALTGFLPEGDLFRTLEINFVNQTNTYSFITDTDNLQFPGDIKPVVPEPSTFILLGAGLAGFAFARKRFKS